MQLLAFLVNQGSKVLRWFAPDFWEHLQRLQSFFSYIWNEVQKNIQPVYSTIWQGLADVYSRATGFVNGLVNAVRNYANDLHGIARNEIGLLGVRFEYNLRQGMNIVQAAMKALQDTLQALVNSFIGRTQVFIWQIRDQLVGFIGMMLPRITALITIALAPVYDFINKHVSAINSQVTRINATIKTISVLIDIFSNSVRQKLVSFFSDPLGYILALLIPIFVDLILQLIAEGFGAVDDTIPQRKDYKTNAARDNLGFDSTRTAAIADELARRSEFSQPNEARDFGTQQEFDRFQQEFSRQLSEVGGDRNSDSYRPAPPTGTAQSRPF